MNSSPQSAAAERVISLRGVAQAEFLGHRDRLLRDIEAEYPGVECRVRAEQLVVRGFGDSLAQAASTVEEMLQLAASSGGAHSSDVRAIARLVRQGRGEQAALLLSEPIVTVRGTAVRAQTAGQRAYVRAIERNTIVFGTGPAGTGKTYLAVAAAVRALKNRAVAKIVLTRPAVEAGERLGYLPGSLEEKIDPYLRPLFDAVGAMLEPELVPQLLASGTIEVAPLAYMRGRTLNDAFVILDEAQNTTAEQMKMFLTRLGFGSQMVITGDLTQVDLPHKRSGLHTVQRVLGEVADVHFAELSADDIVRHSLVGRIVDAYAVYEGELDEH